MKKEVVVTTDDLTGKVLYIDAPTVRFSLDGKAYEIDLGTKEQAKLRKVLKPYVEAGRKVRKTKS